MRRNKMTDMQRKSEIEKSIELIGWGCTVELFTTKEDRAILFKMLNKSKKTRLSKNRKILKENGVIL
jgi:hypothetical protein